MNRAEQWLAFCRRMVALTTPVRARMSPVLLARHMDWRILEARARVRCERRRTQACRRHAVTVRILKDDAGSDAVTRREVMRAIEDSPEYKKMMRA